MAGNLFWNGYKTADNINAWFERQAQANPNVVTVFNIGQSHEGNIDIFTHCQNITVDP